MAVPKFHSLNALIPASSRNPNDVYFVRTANGFTLLRVADTASREWVEFDIGISQANINNWNNVSNAFSNNKLHKVDDNPNGYNLQYFNNITWLEVNGMGLQDIYGQYGGFGAMVGFSPLNSNQGFYMFSRSTGNDFWIQGFGDGALRPRRRIWTSGDFDASAFDKTFLSNYVGSASSGLDINTLNETFKVKVYTSIWNAAGVTTPPTNLFPTNSNANSLISINHGYDDSYNSQLGFDGGSNSMWIRSKNGNWDVNWKRFWHSGDFAPSNINNWNEVYNAWQNGTLGGSGGATALSGLNDINITLASNNQLLKYDSATSKWINWTPNFLTSYTETDPIFNAHTVKNIVNGTGFLKNNGSGSWSYDNSSYALSSHNHSFSSLISTPTTLSGYGITDAYPLSGNPSGFLTSETQTSIQQPVLSGSNLTIYYTGENGTQQSQTVSLAGLVTNDIKLDNASYNASTNIITLTRSDGQTYAIDLSEFSLIPSTDSNGITTLVQEGITKLTISKAGQTGQYNDLLDKPDLSLLIPYSGATGNINIGANTITSTNATGFAGTASNAQTLKTARTINGTPFNGSSDITTTKWGTARTFTFNGDVEGTTNIDGSGDQTISLTLKNTGVSAGVYNSVEVNEKGIVISASNVRKSETQFMVAHNYLDDSAEHVIRFDNDSADYELHMTAASDFEKRIITVANRSSAAGKIVFMNNDVFIKQGTLLTEVNNDESFTIKSVFDLNNNVWVWVVV